MNLKQAYKKATEVISAQTDDAAFDALCLIEHVFKIGRTEYYLKSGTEISDDSFNELMNCAVRRASGEPLQYILGQWDFMGRTFYVGKGVLIPRPETEMIVETALQCIKNKKNPVVIDLCSGSGCIGISVAAEKKDSSVYLFEKSDDALVYLKKNINLNESKNVKWIKGDIFTDHVCFTDIRPDLIVSNPPYIERNVVPTLQEEVLHEPAMALDGGEDGLDFYRAISAYWVPLLNEKGTVVVECGENQGEAIRSIFMENDRVRKSDFYLDFSGNERMVTAEVL